MTGDKAGTVEVDERPIGHYDGVNPFPVPGLMPGEHKVNVKFDDGGNYAQKVYVPEGGYTDVHARVSSSRTLFPHRQGWHFGLSGGAGYRAFGAVDVDVFAAHGGGGEVFVFSNFGAAPAIDLRGGAMVGFSGVEDATLFQLVFPFLMQLNLGSVYAMRFGLHTGLNLYTGGPDVLALYEVAPRGSVATFRFGKKREFEVGIDNYLGFQLGEQLVGTTFGATANFTYLFLSE